MSALTVNKCTPWKWDGVNNIATYFPDTPYEYSLKLDSFQIAYDLNHAIEQHAKKAEKRGRSVLAQAAQQAINRVIENS